LKNRAILILCGLIFFCAVSALQAQNTGATLYVAVKTVEVKASSGSFAKVVGTLAQGDTVTVRQNQGKWLAVRNAAGLEGWAPSDAFSSRRILASGSSVSASEFALAGKGFSDDLEKTLVSSGEFDPKGVDAMEKRTVTTEELRAFLKEGRLSEGD